VARVAGLVDVVTDMVWETIVTRLAFVASRRVCASPAPRGAGRRASPPGRRVRLRFPRGSAVAHHLATAGFGRFRERRIESF